MLKLGRISIAFALLVSTSLTACGVDGGAPAPQQATPTKVESTEARPLRTLLDVSEQRLTQIESRTAQMAVRDVITTADNNEMTDVMQDYTDYMQFAYAATRRDVNLADQSQGKEGASLSAQVFEERAQNHEMRLGNLMGTVEAIQERVRTGQTVLERGIIEAMDEEQRDTFRASLSPAGEKKMQQFYPDLFPRQTLGARLRRGAGQVRDTARQMCRAMPRSLDQVFISRAEASIVFKCIGPCIAQNWGACAACVANSVPAAIQGVRDFESCWRKSSYWIWRTGCVFRLIGVLA